MRKCFLLLFFCISAHASDIRNLQESLKMFRPFQISEHGNVVTVTTHYDRVTPDIYKTMIETGVCVPVWLSKNKKRLTYLSGVKEINILNRFGRFGLVFESPRRSCDELEEFDSDHIDMAVFGRTHGY